MLDVTPLTVGATASMTMFLFEPSELAAPGVARVSVAALPAASLIVPLFSARALVLVKSRSAVLSPGCTVTTGEWYSWYDGATWTAASDVDIDHLVPLKEAWDSGAKQWDDATRERYANDLGDPRTLVAVTDNVNESKGEQDVAEWLPDLQVCRYVRDWVAVKLRWGLAVDRAEHHALVHDARACRNRTITVVHARPVHG